MPHHTPHGHGPHTEAPAPDTHLKRKGGKLERVTKGRKRKRVTGKQETDPEGSGAFHFAQGHTVGWGQWPWVSQPRLQPAASSQSDELGAVAQSLGAKATPLTPRTRLYRFLPCDLGHIAKSHL